MPDHAPTARTQPPIPNWVRRIRADELPALEAQAKSDGNHAIIGATHIFLKHGEPAGYASIGSIALILPWFDTRLCHAKDTIYFGNSMENIAAMAGASHVCIPWNPQSPLHPYVGKLGYHSVGLMDVTFKKLG